MKSILAVTGRLCAGFLAIALLTSCLDVTEEIWIEPDGGGRMRLEMGINARMAALSKFGGEPTQNPFQESEAQLANDSNVESFEVSEAVRGDMTVYVMDVTVGDLSKTVESLTQSGGDGPLGAPGEGMMLTRLKNGNYRFAQPLKFAGAGAEEASNPLTAGLMANMFKGRYVTIRIHGNIVSANGSIAEDGNSVEWKIPLADAVAGRIELEQAEAEISLKSGLSIDPKLLMILAAVAGIMAIAIIAFAMGKRSRA